VVAPKENIRHGSERKERACLPTRGLEGRSSIIECAVRFEDSTGSNCIPWLPSATSFRALWQFQHRVFSTSRWQTGRETFVA
jgi:hypothetical protein